jgi:hypothetical protein
VGFNCTGTPTYPRDHHAPRASHPIPSLPSDPRVNSLSLAATGALRAASTGEGMPPPHLMCDDGECRVLLLQTRGRHSIQPTANARTAKCCAPGQHQHCRMCDSPVSYSFQQRGASQSSLVMVWKHGVGSTYCTAVLCLCVRCPYDIQLRAAGGAGGNALQFAARLSWTRWEGSQLAPHTCVGV